MTTCVLCGNSSSRNTETLPSPCTHVEENSALSCGVCSELSRLDQNIEGIKCSLESAIEQRHAYLERVNHRYDPIRRLPVELVTFVFTLCLPRPPSLDFFDLNDEMKRDLASRPVQFLLGSICRFWRQIVLSTPQLWNILWLHVSPRTTMAQSEVLVEWLGHSGQLPLYVAMFYLEEYTSHDEGSATPAINQMIDTLYPYASRMRVLHLFLLGQQISRFGRRPANVSVVVNTTNTILEELSINVISRLLYSGDGFRLVDQKPKPTHVSFKGMIPQAICVHWGHVTSVEAQGVRKIDVLQLLKMAPQLQQLKISIMADNCRFVPITHGFLKILDVVFYNPGPFLEYLTCPVLEELTYYCNPTLAAFLGRSACPLRKLSVEKFSGFSENLVSVLLLTPLLTHLSLKDFGLPSRFLTPFAETAYFGHNNSETGSFLSHLRSFTCNVSFYRFRWSKIPSLVPQPPDTAMAVRPLSEITITFDQEADLKDVRHAMDRETLAQTLKLVQDGGVVLKVRDIAGLDLIRWSELFHNMI